MDALGHLLNRYDRTTTKLYRYRWVAVSALAATGWVTLAMSFSPWPPIMTLRHIASFPNCNSAHAVGLAPANRGEPGYWQRHDRDRDGKACEAFSRRRESQSREWNIRRF